jgi:chromosome segregation ATPase
MAVRIKTISNDIIGSKRPERHVAHKPGNASDESRQVSKILELEWEALGRKLGKHDSSELEKLRRQVRERDEMLRQANQKIATLKRQIGSLEEKRQSGSHRQAARNRIKTPAGGRK